jgi:hypothetical protein
MKLIFFIYLFSIPFIISKPVNFCIFQNIINNIKNNIYIKNNLTNNITISDEIMQQLWK